MTYFVSDIHLGGGSREQAERTERAFCRWLDMVAEDATEIYLLGDIFDFWFEYLRVVPQGFTRTLGRLAALHDRGIRVVLLSGNHDMWTYDYLTRECGVEIVRKPTIRTIKGINIHLAHGDNMNIKGQPLLRLMNAFFRSRIARWLFRWLVHPDIAMKFGTWWSGKSRKSHGEERITPEKLDYLVDYARQHHATHNGTNHYIFGHMHLAHHVTEDDVEILFLSDWSQAVATYATIDDNSKLTLNTFDIDETISRASR
ncbi:MAG: UDP-2,3-diacylglucosamine diphosphatase [Alistipes sp.]|nr:UDP-2,3-diacylglucosamine diphosphatase [Alistipes sp.]